MLPQSRKETPPLVNEPAPLGSETQILQQAGSPLNLSFLISSENDAVWDLLSAAPGRGWQGWEEWAIAATGDRAFLTSVGRGGR